MDPGIAYLVSSLHSRDAEPAHRALGLGEDGRLAEGTLIAFWNVGLECDGPLTERDELAVSPPDDTWRPVSQQRRASRRC